MAKANTAKTEDTTENFERPVPDNKLPLVVALANATRLPNKEVAFLFIEASDAEALKGLGFANVDSNSKDHNDRVAAQLSDKGLAFADTLSGIEPSTEYTSAKGPTEGEEEAARTRQSTGFKRPDAIEIESGVSLPTIARGRSGENGYPFDKLEVNQSFHIAATTECPDPSKSVASSVSAANKKYSEPKKDEEGNVITEKKRVKKGKDFIMKDFPVLDPIRVFTVRSVDSKDPKGAGCRVWRVK